MENSNTTRKRTIITVIILFLMIAFQTKAQLNYADSLQMQFDSIDTKYFPSGILYNTSPHYWECIEYDSLSQQYQFNHNYLPNPFLYQHGPIEMSYNTYQNIYFDLFISSVRNWAILHPNDYFTNDSIARLTSNFPISILRMNFNELDMTALGTGKLWFDTLINQYTIMPDTIWPPDSLNYSDSIYYLVDNPDSLASLAFNSYWVNGANTTNPYIYTNWTNTSNSTTYHLDYTYSATFSIPFGLFITNDTNSISSVNIDYDDGNGFITQQIGTNKTIEYHELIPKDTVSGQPINIIPKLFEKTIRLKLPPNNQTSDSLTMQFQVKIIINQNPADTSFTTDSLPFLCEVIDSGYSASTALVSIRYANPNYRHLTKPIIISGGFESDLRDYGTLRYEGLMTGVFYTSELELTMQRLKEMPLLLDSLNEMGYDIIFIDQKDPRDYIQNAGLTVIKVVQWVNSELDANGSHNKPIVLGASMGGLIVRYALRMMELQGCCHNTRIYATFDSPHNGANISISSQYFVKDLRDFSETLIPKQKWLDLKPLVKSKVAPIISSYDLVLNSPAARQMLIYHREGSAYSDYSTFYSFLDSIGQPVNCRKLSIVNGSEKAIPNTIASTDKMLLSMKMYSLAPITYFPNPGPWYNWLVLPMPKKLIDFTAYSESKSTIYKYNDAVLASRAHGKAWKELYLYSSMGMTVTDLIGLYPPLTIPMQGVKAGIKGGAGIGFVNLNAKGTTIYNVSNSAYPVSYTEAPGSRSETFKEVADAAKVKVLFDSLALIKAGTPSHTFMPTATTLDMHESNLNLNIKNAYLADPSITPFDCYWAPQRNDHSPNPNMLHVEVDMDNRTWILEQIKNDWELRNGNGEYKGVLSGYYNYSRSGAGTNNDIELLNKPHQTILYSLEIENNGQLFVNKQDKIGLSSGTLYPRNGSIFKLKTNSEPCDSTLVRIKNGGSFIIGDESNGILNKGEVYFRNNSVLEILGNGSLIIKDSSRLIIEEGATLIIHPGAYISLEGHNSVLELKGKVITKDYASFETHGNGFIRFAAEMDANNINDYWQIGNNTSLILSNANNTQLKKAEIVKNIFFPDSLNIFCSNVSVELDSMVTMNIFGSIQAQNSLFTAIDSNKFFYAMKIYGQQNIRFGSCEFRNGHYGLNAQMNYGGNTITLDTCTFSKNYIGLYTSDEYIFINRCTFDKNLDYGWKASNMQSNCDVLESKFENNGYAGAFFEGQNNVLLNVNKSSFSNNYQHGLEISDAKLNSSCSKYSSNGLSGIFAKNNASIDISGNKMNQIKNNNTGILLDRALVLNIEHGFNNFSGNQYFIVGELKPDNYYQGLSNATPISLLYNLLPAPNATQMPINIYLHTTSNNTLVTIPLTNWTQNMNSLQTVCVSSTIPNNYNNYQMFEGRISTALINTKHFQNTYLIDAFKTAAMQMSYGDRYIGNDTLAISLFKEILDNIPVNLNEDEHIAIDDALNQMISTLTYAIENELIDPNRALDGMPVDEYVAMIASEIQNRLNDVDYGNAYAQEQEAYYQLLLAQMYRAAEHYDYALSILQNDNYFFNTTLKNQSEYWNCVCMAENELLKDNIERSEYMVLIDSCQGISTARLAPFSPVFGTNSVLTDQVDNQMIRIYPNPAQQHLAIQFNQRIEEATIEIYDITGKVLWISHVVVKGEQIRLNLPDLISGTYLLKTTTTNSVYNNKLTIK